METICDDLFIGDHWKVTEDSDSTLLVQSLVHDDVYQTVYQFQLPKGNVANVTTVDNTKLL